MVSMLFRLWRQIDQVIPLTCRNFRVLWSKNETSEKERSEFELNMAFCIMVFHHCCFGIAGIDVIKHRHIVIVIQ